MILQLQNGIFTSGIPPILLLHDFFESLMYTFKDTKSAPKKDTTHMPALRNKISKKAGILTFYAGIANRD